MSVQSENPPNNNLYCLSEEPRYVATDRVDSKNSDPTVRMHRLIMLIANRFAILKIQLCDKIQMSSYFTDTINVINKQMSSFFTYLFEIIEN